MIRVLLNGTAYPENFMSWEERKDVITRSEEFWGVTQSASFELQFYRDAYDYIKELDDDFDVAAECTINIQSQNSDLSWADDFTGYIDFSPDSLKYDNQGSTKKLTINAYSIDFSKKLMERMEIEVPYDRLETLDGATITPFANEYENVNIDGIEVLDYNTGLILPEPSMSLNASFPGISHQSILDGWISTTLSNAAGIGGGFVAPSDEWVQDRMFWYNSKITGNMKGNVIIKYKASPSGSTESLRILDYKTLTPVFVENSNYNGGGGTEATIQLDFDYDIDQDSRLVIYLGSSGSITEIIETECTFQLSSRADATACNFVPPFEAGQRIIEAITGQANGLDSPFLGRTDSPVTYSEDGEGSLYFMTNGKLIRQFPTGYITTDSEKKAQLTFSLKEWFESLDKIFCLGAGVKYEDGQYKFYVDDRKEFFKNEASGVAVSRNELKHESFTIEKIPDFYFNEIEVGSAYEKPEEVSGLEEYNSKQKYSSPILNENKLDLINKYIYAAYPVELSRRKSYLEEIAAIIVGGKEETTDYKYDNNNFIFNVERYMSGYNQLSDTDFEEINGLSNITTYINLNITPKRNIKRHGWFINSGLRGYQSGYLKYNKSDIVTDLSTRKVGEGELTTENEDILISSLDSPIFTGRMVSFNAPVSPETFKTLQADPYGLIEYYDPINENVGYGFLKEVSTSLIDKTTNWQLYETNYTGSDENFRLLQDGSYRLLEDGGRRLLEN